MPTFNQKFFKHIKEPAQKTSLKTKEKLRSIYNTEVVNYKNVQDFDICKQQFLQLLNYITQLNPQTLEIFSAYSHMIEQNLLNTSSQENINITLKSMKESIENSLISIEENHNKFCRATFQDYIVDQCIPGAFSNMECVLEHFHHGYFSLILASAKKKLLKECIAQFVRQLDDKIDKNYEVHFINGLYNTLHDAYGCTAQIEPLATKTFEERGIINRCKKFVEKKFTVSSFIQMLLTQIENPPCYTIKNSNDFSKVEDFFRLINLSTKEKNHLYLIDDDGYLDPKPYFNVYLQCIIAYHLNKLGYINDIYLTVDNTILLDNGEHIVRCDDSNEYCVLEDEYLLRLIKNKNNETSIRLIEQLSIKTLYQKLTSSEKKDLYLNAILKKSYLPNETIINLNDYLCDHLNEVAFIEPFINHVFFNLYPLPIDNISKLAKKISPNKIDKYFKRAITANKIDFINALLPYVSKDCYKFAAIFSVTHAHIKLFKTISKYIDINNVVTQYDANTLAHLAVINRHLDLLKTLYLLGANLHIKNRDGYSPVHLIFQFGDIAMLEWFASTVNPNLFKKIDLECYLLIHIAANENHSHVLNWIQENHPDLLHEIDEEGHTIAHWAAYNDDIQTLHWLPLIDIKLLTVADSEGSTPLFLAAQRNSIEAFKWIIKFYPEQLNCVDKNGFTIAHTATQYGSIDILNFLNEYMPALISKKDNIGNLISHIASYENQIKVLDWIKQHHPALLDQANNNSCTIAHIATYKAYTDILLWVKEHNDTLLNKPDKDNNTPIHLAAQRGQMDILLLFHAMNLPEINWYDILNIKPRVHSNQQGTLVHLAVNTRNLHFLKLLKKYKIDVNLFDGKGYTPIMLALCSNNENFFHLLIKMGANIQVQDKNGNTLYHYIYKIKFNDMQKKQWIDILKKYNFSFETINKKGQNHKVTSNQKSLIHNESDINNHPKDSGFLYGFKNYRLQKATKSNSKKVNPHLNLRASV